MTDKLYDRLTTVIRLENKILRMQLEIDEFYSLIGGLTAIRYDKDKVQTSPEDVLGKNMAKLDEMRRDLDKERAKVPKALETVTSLINTVEDDNGKTVLYHRYIKRIHFEQIADIMGYGVDNIYRLHRMAIRELEKSIQ